MNNDRKPLLSGGWRLKGGGCGSLWSCSTFKMSLYINLTLCFCCRVWFTLLVWTAISDISCSIEQIVHVKIAMKPWVLFLLSAQSPTSLLIISLTLEIYEQALITSAKHSSKIQLDYRFVRIWCQTLTNLTNLLHACFAWLLEHTGIHNTCFSATGRLQL